jgi:hypothetical protein
MSCSVYGYAVIGLSINWDQICSGTKKVKAFKHNHPEDWQVDPKTGKQLWAEKDVFIEGWNERKETLCGYSVIHGYEDDVALVCVASVSTDDLMYRGHPERAKLPSPEEIELFKEAMQKIGLWDDDRFGLIAHGWASC